jgi:hypothetical protein
VDDFITMQAAAHLSPNPPPPSNLHLLLLIGVKREPSQSNLTGFVLNNSRQLPTRLVASIRPNYHGLNLC